MSNEISKKIIMALEEDQIKNDVTTLNLIKKDQIDNAILIAKEDGVIAGVKVFKEVFNTVDKTVRVSLKVKDGDKVKKGDVIANISGNTRSILLSERVALNFLQRMSGIATITSHFAKKLKGTSAFIYDTRKTTPLLREFEKSAVKIGGGKNHRFSLADMAMIKDNHIAAAGSITEAIKTIRKKTKVKIAVEVETIAQFKEAIAAKPDIIMLDNMSLENMKKCVKLKEGKVQIEATGNVTLDNVAKIAKTGVDRISTGAITHSYKSLDISLRFK